jgi:hypothetical protein
MVEHLSRIIQNGNVQNSLFWFVTMPVFALLLLTAGIGTRAVMYPQAIQYVQSASPFAPDNYMVIHRSYPLSDWFGIQRPWIRYTQTVHPLTKTTNGGYSCIETNNHGMRYTHDDPAGFGSWSMSWAAACMNDPVGWKYEATWRGYLFDLFPMRTVSITLVHFVDKSQYDMAGRKGGVL